MRKLVVGFQQLNIRQRFLLSICFFSLPLAVLFYFNIDQISSNVAFASQESAGLSYQRPLVRLVKALGDHRLRGAAVDGARTPPVAQGGQQEIESLLEQFRSVHQNAASRLSVTDAGLKEAGLEASTPTALALQWQAVSDAVPGDSGTQSRYEYLIKNVRALISRTADSSNLTLDPEMDSYYLSDVAAVAAVQALDRIGSIMLLVEPALGRRALSLNERSQLIGASALLKEADFDRIVNDIETAFRENAKNPHGPSQTLRPRTEGAFQKYQQAMHRFQTLIASAATGNVMNREDFHNAAAGASQSCLDLWEGSSAGLDGLLGVRAAYLSWYRWKLILGTGIALAVAIGLFILVLRDIVRPLVASVSHLERVARGDISQDVAGQYLERGDEIGVLARAMQAMSQNLRGMIRDVSSGIEVVSSSSVELSANSAQMSRGSREASEHSHSVAAASEQVSVNVTCVASGMAQAATNLEHVTGSVRRMDTMVEEIARNSEGARRIADEAANQAEYVTKQMHSLGEAAREIGKVTESISQISAQTNLLALNATIEAARAGQAGRGFAVVANEIKELATQTASATEDIKIRIGRVQESTGSGISATESIAQVIHKVRDIVGTITAAIQQQTAVTKDIARNIEVASLGVQEANDKVAETSHATREIAREIAAIDQAASRMVEGSEQVDRSAGDLSRLAEQLRSTVVHFEV